MKNHPVALAVGIVSFLLLTTPSISNAKDYCCDAETIKTYGGCPAIDNQILYCKAQDACAAGFTKCDPFVSLKVYCCDASAIAMSGGSCPALDIQIANCKTMATCTSGYTTCSQVEEKSKSSGSAAATASAPAPVAKVIKVPNALNTPYIQVILGRFASILVGISGSVGLLVFVWAGITMITAEGDAKKIASAKGMMLWTAIGLAIIFTSEALVRAVMNVLISGSVS